MVEKKKMTPQEGLAAAAVAVIAAWSPVEDTGMVMRLIYAVCALACLFVASVGLELLQEWRKAAAEPKANPFDVKIVKVELPTAPPGGVFEASCMMATHLNGFEVKLTSEVRAGRSAGLRAPLPAAHHRAPCATGKQVVYQSESHAPPAWPSLAGQGD